MGTDEIVLTRVMCTNEVGCTYVLTGSRWYNREMTCRVVCRCLGDGNGNRMF